MRCQGSGGAVSCLPGFTATASGCEDINECLAGNGGCDANAYCINLQGSRTCTCRPGYGGDGVSCPDINECLVDNGGCGTGACTNTAGGSSCGCPAGYTGNGINCVDVNECASNNGGCAAGTTCENLLGGMRCKASGGGTTSCPVGYVQSGSGCVDLNECASNNGGCSPNALCVNRTGTFECYCNSGFTGDGFTCSDVDECANNNGGCGTNPCYNTVGGFRCNCPTGFIGDGANCIAAGTCSTHNGGCDAHATCSVATGFLECTCKAGYTGNGFTCTDINECMSNNGGCSLFAQCTNTPGGRTCACLPTYGGDGFSCTKIEGFPSVPGAVDSDCDGLINSDEDVNGNQLVDTGESNYFNSDTDGDGLLDGLESFDGGMGVPVSADSNCTGIYPGDQDTLARSTHRLNPDTDGDGILDGTEDLNRDGRKDALESDPLRLDTDCDGLRDDVEDANKNGRQDPGETSTTDSDSDDDGILDGIERGIGRSPDSACTSFNTLGATLNGSTAGACGPGSTPVCKVLTDPLDFDTDDDAIPDGSEDTNKNGLYEAGELNPRNFSDGNGPSGKACGAAGQRPISFRRVEVPDIQLAVASTFNVVNMSSGGALKGMQGTDGNVAFLAFRASPPGADVTADEASFRARINGVRGLNNNTTTQTFRTWDGSSALQAFYETAGGDPGTLYARANELANTLVGAGAGVLPPGGPSGPFKLQVQYVRRSNLTLVVVIALTPLSAFTEPTLFKVGDVAGGSGLAQFGDTSPDSPQCETFQPKVGNVDFLFVVDDSCSMASYQDSLAQAANAMANKLNNTLLDYRIALVTTSYPGNGIRGFVDKNGIQTFKNWLTRGASGWVGTSGRGDERMLLAGAAAITDMGQGGSSSVKFRADADIVLILLGDADDQSSYGGESYVPFYNTPGGTLGGWINRSRKAVPVHGIICPEGQGCGETQYNPHRNGIVVARTGGVRGNINDSVCISNAMGAIVDSTIATTGHKLARPPISATLKVAISSVTDPAVCNKDDLPRSRVNGFDFDGVTGTLNFFGKCQPPTGTHNAAVSYRYWEDKTSFPDGSTLPCANDPFFDRNAADYCSGLYACNRILNICAAP